jgi:FlaA1/EpsC-like NDP-sugar epimerase
VVNLLLALTRAQKRLIFLGVDMVLAPLALFVAHAIDASTLWPLTRLQDSRELLPALLAMTIGLSLLLSIADGRPKDFDRASALRMVGFAALLAAATALVSRVLGITLAAGFYVVFAMVYFAFCAGARLAILHLLNAIYGHSRAITNVLIYGAGRTGMAVASALRKRADIVPLAFIDDSPTLVGYSVGGLPVHLARDIEDFCARARIDRVIIAIPSLSHHRRAAIARRFGALGIDTWTLPAFSDLMGEAGLLDKLLPAAPRAILQREEAISGQAKVLDIYAGAAVMITGAGGSIGQELCRQVLALAPRRLVLFDLNELSLFTLEQQLEAQARDCGVELVTVLGSVADAALLDLTLRDNAVEVILHAAAYKHVPMVQKNVLSGLANNAIGTEILALKAREHGVGRFVLVSTDKAVRPKNVMGASKRVAELVIQDLASRPGRTIFAAVRFGNVLGSSGSVLPLFQEQIQRGGPVTVTDPEATRYFMTVEEASALVLLGGAFAAGGEIFALDMGDPIPIGTLARRLVELSGFTVRDQANPGGDVEIIATGLRPGEKKHEERLVGPGVITTAHPRIARINAPCLSQLETASLMRDLRDAVNRMDEATALAALARWLPDFAAQQSVQRPLPGEDRHAATT